MELNNERDIVMLVVAKPQRNFLQQRSKVRSVRAILI